MEKQAAATDSLSPFLMVATKSSFTVLLTLSSISGVCMRFCSWNLVYQTIPCAG